MKLWEKELNELEREEEQTQIAENDKRQTPMNYIVKKKKSQEIHYQGSLN